MPVDQRTFVHFLIFGLRQTSNGTFGGEKWTLVASKPSSTLRVFIMKSYFGFQITVMTDVYIRYDFCHTTSDPFYDFIA